MMNPRKLWMNWFGMLAIGGMLVLVCQSFVHGQEGAEPGSSLFTMNADGSEVELLAHGGLPGLERMGSPHWSPDGRYIAFDVVPGRVENPRLGRIAAIAVDGPLRGKVQDLGYGNCPRWSPDSQRIAFFLNSGNPSGVRAGAWRMNADGTDRRWLNSAYYPRWAPDGETVLCTDGFDGPHSYFLVNVFTGASRQILENFVCMGIPDWSPDGKQIVSTFLISDELVLARVKISGTSESFVPLRKGPLPQRRDPTKPVWSPDGGTILLADLTGNILSIPASPFASTEATLLFSQDGVRTRNAVWSPDSQKIVFVHRKIGPPKTDVAEKTDEK